MIYSEARELMKPGDLMGFSGKSAFSLAIKAGTFCDISHVGVILQAVPAVGVPQINLIIESTSLGDGFAGVQINRMSMHVQKYQGEIYWYPMKKETRKNFDHVAFYTYMLAQEGKSYDMPQAILSAIDFVPANTEDDKKLFCSELALETQNCST